MKKIILFAATLLATGAMMAQTIVSTTPSQKNVILEEYTGVNCGYCPDGHRIANELAAANPGRFFAINIHQGGYAPRYTTQWGNALANQAGISSYPNGTLNRHAFSGTSIKLDRNQWASKTAILLGEDSPVNIAAEATIDMATRVMTINVEAYYTANSEAETNFLNIAILQDSIIGPQGGASSYNPSQVINGNEYIHMHMLRDLVTGQWGEQIDTTTAGYFYHKTFTYNVPETISNEEMVLEHLNVIAFIAEGHKEILTGCKANITRLNGLPRVAGFITKVSNDCEIAFNAGVMVRNLGEDVINSLELTYVFNGNTEVYDEWEGEILPGETDTIALPLLSGDLENSTTYPLEVYISGINGDPFESATRTTEVSKTVYSAAGPFELTIATDKYASETTFDFSSTNGTVIVSGGPWANANNVIKRMYNIDPAEAGCYILNVYDAAGDGINSGYGAGYIFFKNNDGQVFRNNGKFADKITFYINVTNNGTGNVGIDGVANANLNIYPNPTTNLLNIECNQTIDQVLVYDVTGRQVMVLNGNVNQIATESLSNGIYTVRVITENGITTQKFVKE